MTKAQLERYYGIKIKDDSYWHPLQNRVVRQYKYYCADGNRWSNGLKTLKAVEADCREWKDALLKIKASVERDRDEIIPHIHELAGRFVTAYNAGRWDGETYCKIWDLCNENGVLCGEDERGLYIDDDVYYYNKED